MNDINLSIGLVGNTDASHLSVNFDEGPHNDILCNSLIVQGVR